MRYCVTCHAPRPETGEWCTFCLQRYEPHPRPTPRWWQPAVTRNGIAGRLAWAAAGLALFWPALATVDDLGASPGRKLLGYAVVLTIPAVWFILWRRD